MPWRFLKKLTDFNYGLKEALKGKEEDLKG